MVRFIGLLNLDSYFFKWFWIYMEQRVHVSCVFSALVQMLKSCYGELADLSKLCVYIKTTN